MKMGITIKETTTVSPAEETPKQKLWVSNIDLVMTRFHVSTLYFYKPNGCNRSDFFDTKVLKEALSKVLVPFYPVAGRLGCDENGRLEIICNGEGVLFIDAETSSSVFDDLVEDFTDSEKILQLVPKIDCSGGISSYPLLALQVTRFNCGGISLGVSSHHTMADGPSALHFINSWAEMAQGLSPSIAPFLDRTLLRARDPPTPRFRHLEYQPSPCLKTIPESQSSSKPAIVSVFKITADQINTLKAKVNDSVSSSGKTKYSTFSIMAAHIWRCATKARGLLRDQELKLTIPVNGRNRFNPPLPPGYFGNVIFYAAPVAVAGDLLSEPFMDTVKRLHETMKVMDDEYLRSGIDYIEKAADVESAMRGPRTMRCPNLSINGWNSLPIHDADFGWGRPVLMRPANIIHEGKTYILQSPTRDGSLTLVTYLEASHTKLFGNLLYEFWQTNDENMAEDHHHHHRLGQACQVNGT